MRSHFVLPEFGGPTMTFTPGLNFNRSSDPPYGSRESSLMTRVGWFIDQSPRQSVSAQLLHRRFHKQASSVRSLAFCREPSSLASSRRSNLHRRQFSTDAWLSSYRSQ